MAEELHDIEFHEDDLLYSTQFGDHYYSRNDGRAECDHVFLAGNGLPERWQSVDHFTIGELGFGTGLNFLATWARWCVTRREGQKLSFLSLEGFPLAGESAARALACWPQLGELAQQLLRHWGELGTGVWLDPQTHLQVIFGEAANGVDQFPSIDAWYLDGFSPSRNPDMWSLQLIQQVFLKTRPGGTCATYTAAGWVRRNLADAGFSVEKRRGFGTKRDMTVGVKMKVVR